MIPEPGGSEVAHAEPCPVARSAVRGDRDRHGGEVQAGQAGAGPAGDLAAVTAAPAGQVNEDLPGPTCSAAATSAMPAPGSRLLETTCEGRTSACWKIRAHTGGANTP
jgi:hypothetical protein